MNYSLTETEFNGIGKQAFADWFRSIQKYTLVPHDNIIDVVYNHKDAILTIVVKTTRFVYLYYDHTCDRNGDGWRVLHTTITSYKSSQAVQLVIDSLKRFIEIEKIKLIAKPYGEDIVKKVEELFY